MLSRVVCAGLRWTGIGAVVGGVTAVLFFYLIWTLAAAFDTVLLAFVAIGVIAEVDHQKKLSAESPPKAKDADQMILEYVNGIGTKPAGRLNVPHDYFMPYCVCPKCDNEALHWMEDGQLDVNDEKLMYRMGAEAEALTGYYEATDRGFYRQQFRDLGMSHEEIDKAVEEVNRRRQERQNQRLIDKGRDIAHKQNAERHVIRTCRNCGQTWDQRIGWEAWW